MTFDEWWNMVCLQPRDRVLMQQTWNAARQATLKEAADVVERTGDNGELLRRMAEEG